MTPSAVLPISIAAAAIPTLFYVTVIYWVDRYEKEPLWLLAAAFLWGAIPSIIVAFIFNTILSLPFYLVAGESTGDALAASLIAPPVEESLKGLALVAILLFWRHEIDSLLDGIVYGAIVGMGFAMVENVYYFVSVFNESGIEAWGMNVFLRAFIFGLNHAMFSSITGLGIAIARMSVNRSTRLVAPLLGWMGAMFLHFLHNLATSSGSLLCLVALVADWGGIGITGLIVLWALLQERQWLKRYLAEEVAYGTLTTNQYLVASSSRKRFARAYQLLLTNGLSPFLATIRYHQRCSELAYKKHHSSLFDTPENALRVEQARTEVKRHTPGRSLIS